MKFNPITATVSFTNTPTGNYILDVVNGKAVLTKEVS